LLPSGLTAALALFVSRLASVRSPVSFPTRRSSDLGCRGGAGGDVAQALVHDGLGEDGGGGGAVAGHVVGLGRDLLRELRAEVLEIGRDTSELQSRFDLVCRLLLEKKKPPPEYCTSD